MALVYCHKKTANTNNFFQIILSQHYCVSHALHGVAHYQGLVATGFSAKNQNALIYTRMLG